MTPVERFLAKIEVTESGCWEWMGSRTAGGYGQMRVGSLTDGTRKMEMTHRLAHEWWIGPIPPGFDVDHRCRNRACCNPDHLEAVTRAENLARGINKESAKTHCKRGHPYDAQNTRIYNGHRWCRACDRERGPRAVRA